MKTTAEYDRNWKKKNPKKVKASSDRYRLNNPIKIKQRSKLNHIKMKNKTDNIMHNLKINGCAICGYNKCKDALCFHHTNPENKKIQLNITGLRGYDKTIADELNKCILLCENCHREIHYLERCGSNP